MLQIGQEISSSLACLKQWDVTFLKSSWFWIPLISIFSSQKGHFQHSWFAVSSFACKRSLWVLSSSLKQDFKCFDENQFSYRFRDILHKVFLGLAYFCEFCKKKKDSIWETEYKSFLMRKKGKQQNTSLQLEYSSIFVNRNIKIDVKTMSKEAPEISWL